MPLRDHFHAPWLDHNYWESFHDGWINTLVRHLNGKLLPKRFRALPQVHLGIYGAADVATMKKNGRAATGNEDRGHESAGVATAVWAPPKPHHTLHVSFPEEDIFEVRIHDTQRRLRLVGAIELVSPANKDRPESRQLLVAKCLSLLRKDVCLSIIDIVIIREFNLYTELLGMLERSDPAFSPPPPTYAVTCRKRHVGSQTKLDIWSWALAVGQPLPVLPIWLPQAQTVSLNLEATYEETCRVLRIP